MTDREPTNATTDKSEVRTGHGDARLEPASLEGIDADVEGTVASSVALAALVGTFTVLAGPTGAATGLATAIAWYAVGTPYGVALGHVALVALFPEGIDRVSFAVAEASFVAVLLATGPHTAVGTQVRRAVAALASALVLGATVWIALVPAGQPLWVATIALLAALACGCYGLHRYGRIVVHDRIDRSTDEPSSESVGAEPKTDAPDRTGTSIGASTTTDLSSSENHVDQ